MRDRTHRIRINQNVNRLTKTSTKWLLGRHFFWMLFTYQTVQRPPFVLDFLNVLYSAFDGKTRTAPERSLSLCLISSLCSDLPLRQFWLLIFSKSNVFLQGEVGTLCHMVLGLWTVLKSTIRSLVGVIDLSPTHASTKWLISGNVHV